MNHIPVVFIKFWIRQSCLKQNPTGWESCRNGKSGKNADFVLKSSIWSEWITFSWFPSNSGSDSRIKGKFQQIGKLQKWKKWKSANFTQKVLDCGQNKSHFRDFHQILGKTVVFKAISNKLGRLQKMEKMEKRRFPPQILYSDQNQITFCDPHQVFQVGQLYFTGNPWHACSILHLLVSNKMKWWVRGYCVHFIETNTEVWGTVSVCG